MPIYRFLTGALAFFISSCGALSEPPPRFNYEIYDDCEMIEQRWESDYRELAKRRFARGQNVFVYKTPPGGGVLIFGGGLEDANRALTDAAKNAISKGGAWGVVYPDTGCPNIPEDVREHYIGRYNQFALSLYS